MAQGAGAAGVAGLAGGNGEAEAVAEHGSLFRGVLGRVGRLLQEVAQQPLAAVAAVVSWRFRADQMRNQPVQGCGGVWVQLDHCAQV